MPFDLHFRSGVRHRLDELASEMSAWEAIPRFDENMRARLGRAIQSFRHTTSRSSMRWAGVDGSGDFPALEYADAFVYVSTAQATCYEATPQGLREVDGTTPIVDFVWLPNDEDRRVQLFDAALERLAGASLDEVIEGSDYRSLKSVATGKHHGSGALRDVLIRPAAFDASNIGIQLRSAGELGAALRVLRDDSLRADYVLLDTTLSLPLVQRADLSLFAEHLKRLLCVEARKRGRVVLFLSKSHGLPGMDVIEAAARESLGLPRASVAEHWFLRVPMNDMDGWSLPLDRNFRLPPVGAISYLVRFHHTTPVLRLDMDHLYWERRIRGGTDEQTTARERALFEDLDFACHDQRCYGYPYPIRAGQDRAALSKAERVALRKQIVDAAVRAGMSRSVFRDAAFQAGHE